MKSHSTKTYVNFYLRKFIKNKSLIFGQNILAGSGISGLSTGFEKIKNVSIFNTQNSESSLVGFGMGALISGNSALYIAKQLDFILLSMDHLVNTYNSAILQNPKGSFVIVTYIVDTDTEGPQSRLNCLSEFASISKINCRYLIFKKDIKKNINLALKKKGMTILCLSQQFGNKKEYDLYNNFKKIELDKDGKYVRYKFGKKRTLVCYGFSIYEVDSLIKKKYPNSDLFIITDPLNSNINQIIRSAKMTKNVILFDNSSSKNKHIYYLENRLTKYKILIEKKIFNESINDLRPNKFKNKII